MAIKTILSKVRDLSALIFFLTVFSFFDVYAQNISSEVTSNWHKFEKNTFKFNGTEAWYIKPKNAAAGNPWVWRAHFPNWHTQMDSILLERGFHIAYINTNDPYGHPKAMMIWDDFYEYLVKQKKFSSKVALEGVSRGGLYIYGWAKRNPAKVSCIYAEAPVCDIKSWPAGKGMGIGSAKDWAKFKEVYRFTEEQALAFNDLPINDLIGLASFNVPLLHVVGLQDSIVPASENTNVLFKNYEKLGGSVTLVPVTTGPQQLNGHHFPITTPEKLADFIEKNSLPVKQRISEDKFIQLFGNLNNFKYRITKDKKATVAFLGGSITDMQGWRDKVSNYLKELFPTTDFTFINAGIPSLGSVPHAFRLKNDVLNKGKIDIMFIESAVNDLANETPELEQRKALEGIIRQSYKANPYINMVMMAFVDENKVNDYRSGKIPVEVKVHNDLAKYYHLNFINLAEAVSQRIAAGEFTWKEDFKNLHPSPFGQEIYFSQIKTLFRKELIAEDIASLSSFKLPVELQEYCYENGNYVSLDKAILKQGFQMDLSWKPEKNENTRKGFVNVPALVADKPNAELSLKFNGTAVGIAVVAGPDAGIINYSIDGAGLKSVNLYTKPSKNLHLPRYFLLGDNLAAGEHTISIIVANQHDVESTGNACRIVHFLVNHEK